MKFCPNCGKEIVENASYCVGCGLDMTNFNTNELKKYSQNDSSKQEVIITKSQSWGNKITMIMGAIVILLATITSNPYNMLLGIVLLVFGFISLKNKSKTIDQFLKIASLILVVIAIINLLK